MVKKKTTKRRKTSKGMEGKPPIRATISRRAFESSESKMISIGGKKVLLSVKRGK